MIEHSANVANSYKALFEQASDCMLLADFEGNLIDVNASMCEKFGYAREELLKMNVHALIDEEDYKERPISFELIRRGEHILNKRRMVLKDGTIIEVETNAKKFSATSIMAIVRDVTERNKAKAYLQHTYERLYYHLNNTPLAVIEEDKNFCVTYWNKQAEEIFGWEAEEILGKRLIDFMVPEEDRKQIEEIIENFGKGIRPKQPNENKNYTKSGKVLHCQWYPSLLLDAQGNIETILSIVKDNTEIRTKEQKLQQYLVLLKDLSFVTSHELRNEYVKVQSVLDYMELAQGEGQLGAKDRSFLLKEAAQSFHNINKVISKLSDKIGAGQHLIDD